MMARVSIAALVDELGAMAETLSEARRLTKRADVIKALLREHAEKRHPEAEASVRIRGNRWIATVGGYPPARTIRLTMPKLFARLGQKTFLKICTVTVKAIEDSLDPEQCESILAAGHGPTRPVTVEPK